MALLIGAEYTSFLDTVVPTEKSAFKSFAKDNDRVDCFWLKFLDDHERVKIVQMCLVLSHGNAVVERGFSVNKEVEVENLSLQSLIAQRTICDYVHSIGGIKQVTLSSTLLKSAKEARKRYEDYLINQRKEKADVARKRKLDELQDQEEFLKQRIMRLAADLCELSPDLSLITGTAIEFH